MMLTADGSIVNKKRCISRARLTSTTVTMAESTGKATLARRGISSAEVIQQFNIENAKIIATLLLSGMLIFHGVLKITSGKLWLHFLS